MTHQVRVHNLSLRLQPGHVPHKAVHRRHARRAAHQQHLAHGQPPLGPDLHASCCCSSSSSPAALAAAFGAAFAAGGLAAPAAPLAAAALDLLLMLGQHRAEIHTGLRGSSRGQPAISMHYTATFHCNISLNIFQCNTL